jgi:AAA+ superfamily predicted ATPase
VKSFKAKDSFKVHAPAPVDLSLKHLQAELARIDVLIRREVRRWQIAGQDFGDAFRGLKVSDADANALMARPLATSWGHTAALDPLEAQALAEAEAQAAREAQALLQSSPQPLRLSRLAATFDLDRFDLDALLIGLAPMIDLRYERLYGYLQDDVTRKRPSINLILDLLAEPGPQRLQLLSHFADDAPLIRHHLLEPIADGHGDTRSTLSQTLQVDQSIVSWLLGQYQPHTELGSQAELITPTPHPIDELLVAPIRSDMTRAMVERPIIALYGSDHTSQRAAANVLAIDLKRPLLIVNLSTIINEAVTPLRAVRLALRDALLTNAIPCLLGWDACLVDGAPQPDALREVCAHPDIAIVTSQSVWQPRGADRTRAVMWLDFPIPDYPQRKALWEYFLATRDRHAESGGDKASRPGEGDSEWDLTLLAGQFLLTATQIRDAVASAGDMAAQRGEAIGTQDLFAAARSHSSPSLSGLARKINPRYTWQDIVLPDDQLAMLHEIIATVRGRPTVLEAWGIGHKLASSNGITVLFSGPPGTGKTMAAEVISSELGLDLYKIDLSTVINKYVGETEKNLSRIFDEATSSNAILFFDEADALFGKRSEVKDSHDRYANIEISYLLQRMEAYDGITILATNLRSNMDEAFKRRLQFAIDFPFPDEAYRLRIWQTLFPADVPRADLDFELMAKRFKLAGGNIRNIIVSAAYLASANGGIVSMEHLLHGARRELQKMGRLINEKDLANG